MDVTLYHELRRDVVQSPADFIGDMTQRLAAVRTGQGHTPGDIPLISIRVRTLSRHKPDMAGQKLQRLATFQPGDNFTVVIQSDLVKRSERDFVDTTSSMHPVDDCLISDVPKRINGISGYPEF
ncbi:hypothetical protein [Klebsiella michiganensis]|uniref:hypothetical protein n=1 Tax=Klebsiella michiganensis TaxID=1134687 RepID=UPI001E61D72C|nr:hypothetical protein [Klebsiella michiganensis]